MFIKNRALSIIPARGGSKGIPRKNIRLLAGKPLIAYSIEAALRSKCIDRVVVSTEDDEIADISRIYGAIVVKRPEELAEDESPTIDAVIHILNSVEQSGYYSDMVILLQPTSPLRTSEDIDGAVNIFLKERPESLISVCESEHSPYWTFKIEGNLLKTISDGEFLKMRRQDIPEGYFPNGAIFISTPENLRRFRTFYCSKTIPYIMPAERSIDIDTEVDLKVAEVMIKARSVVMNRIEISDKWVGDGCPTFIIAEAGVNHNGSLKLAKKMIDIAFEAGVDAVKFQTFKTENVITTGAEKAKYQKERCPEGESQFEMLKKLEFSAPEFHELSDYCREKGIMFLSSPFDMESVDLLAELDVPAFKIASGEITNFPLLRKVSKKVKPIILSTGMSSLEEISDAVEVLKRNGACDVILLHCTSEYPAKFEDINLRAIITMKEDFEYPIGFSDHTPGIIAPIAAVALGACVVEKHFTIDKSLPGPDHKASLDPLELRQMVEGIRNVEIALGDGKKVPKDGEEEIRKVARKSIVAASQICKGESITEEMLTTKRPGTGIEPKKMSFVVGKTASRDIRKDEILSPEMLE